MRALVVYESMYGSTRAIAYVVAAESFLVEDAEGPLADGEADRARAWGAELGARTTA
jgi:hypothetical protein